MTQAHMHLMQVTKDAFQQLLGKEPKVAAIHAGLECGIIGEKVPGMDAVSYGPTITGAHSPDEQVSSLGLWHTVAGSVAALPAYIVRARAASFCQSTALLPSLGTASKLQLMISMRNLGSVWLQLQFVTDWVNMYIPA